MALDTGQHRPHSLMDDGRPVDAGLSNDLYERDTGRSNFTAFLLGGVVIAGGLLGFLYYDTDNLSQRDGLTTGAIGGIASPASVPSLKVPVDVPSKSVP